MPSDTIDNWLNSGQQARIGQSKLAPVENSILRGKPLSSQKGQAEAFFLTDDRGQWSILKKFHLACKLDRDYLENISRLLPKESGFYSGTARNLLKPDALRKEKGLYFHKKLATWLDGTVLMPRVEGVDWAMLADDMRSGSIVLDDEHRLTLCKNLSQLVEAMEQVQCCHRDLSCGNVFIDTTTWEVVLIDFDSLYHPTLQMPKATTCGTVGYTSHHAWDLSGIDARQTWCPRVDRYALALLNTEFLFVDQNSPITGEGGIFNQDELRNRTGPGINQVLGELQSRHPVAATLLLRTFNSSSFADIPAPQEWIAYCESQLGPKAPPLSDMTIVTRMDLAAILDKCRPPAPLWPTPTLQDMPQVLPRIPHNISVS